MSNRKNEQIEKISKFGRKAADETARTARGLGRETAKAGDQAARAGANIVYWGAETARDGLHATLNTAVRNLQRVTDQFGQMLGFAAPEAEDLARRSSQNIEAVSQAGAVLANGVQKISQECLNLAQDRFAKNLDALNRLAGCRSVQDFVAVQTDVVRERLGQTIESSRHIAEASMRVADEAAGVIELQVDRHADELDRARRAA